MVEFCLEKEIMERLDDLHLVEGREYVISVPDDADTLIYKLVAVEHGYRVMMERTIWYDDLFGGITQGSPPEQDRYLVAIDIERGNEIGMLEVSIAGALGECVPSQPLVNQYLSQANAILLDAIELYTRATDILAIQLGN